MAIISANFSNPIINFPLTCCIKIPSSRLSVPRNPLISRSSANSMEYSGDEHRAKFMDFPYVSGPIRNVMVELLSTVETHLGSSLHPDCTLPPDVQYFQNPTATAHASLHLRSGLPSSQIDFILGGWIHCKSPSGGALNITSLAAYLKPSTDAPHFLLDLIQSTPTSSVLHLDLTPRKDLILCPHYLKTYFENTPLETNRQRLHTLPEVTPYVSPSLYIRTLLSPASILVRIVTGSAGETTNDMDEIIRDHVGPIAKELLQFWIESCACAERRVGASERDYLAERDRMIKSTTVEVDLGSSFPRLFWEEVAGRVLNVLKQNYNI